MKGEDLGEPMKVCGECGRPLPGGRECTCQETAEQKRARVARWRNGESSERAGMANAYRCEECQHVTLVTLRDGGTTPFMVGCTIEGCQGMAQSARYNLPGPMELRAKLAATHEYIAPDEAEMADYLVYSRRRGPYADRELDDEWVHIAQQVRKHVEDGGLVMVPKNDGAWRQSQQRSRRQRDRLDEFLRGRYRRN